MFKPLLASPADLTKLRFPLLASPKLDGVRAIVIDGVVMSRSLKPIPNRYVQSLFAQYEHLDGELIVGPPTSHSVYRDTVSHVMSHDRDDFDVKFYAFDHIEAPHEPFHARHDRLSRAMLLACNRVEHLEQVEVHDSSELSQWEDAYLQLGYEGLILRDPAGKYKFGRSTTREGILLKLKRYEDCEAEVIGFEERMHNGNEATVSELGYTKRSTHAANKTGLGDLGALVCRAPGWSETFAIGTGFDAADRVEIWNNRPAYLGATVKFKHFAIGAKDRPRHPVFLGWRSPLDM